MRVFDWGCWARADPKDAPAGFLATAASLFRGSLAYPQNRERIKVQQACMKTATPIASMTRSYRVIRRV
jgi:hypothetical protein